MTLRALYQSYTITQAREFKERRDALPLELLGEYVREGLKEAKGFDVRLLI